MSSSTQLTKQFKDIMSTVTREGPKGNTYLSYAGVNRCTLSHVRNLGVNFIHVGDCWIVELFLFHLNEFFICLFPFTFECVFLLKR